MNTKKPAHKNQPTKCKPPAPAPQWWVLDTGSEGMSEHTLEAHGPFVSQGSAEQWIKDTSAEDWLSSCGCLRTGGKPEDWGDEYIIVRVMRRVRPVPPSNVEMTLRDTASDQTEPRQ